MHIKKILLLIIPVVLLVLNACGLCQHTARPSTKSLTFNSAGDSAVVTTRSTFWWISCFSINEEYYCFFHNIDVTQPNYTIDTAGVTLERKNGTILKIKIDSNPLSTIRTIIIELQEGDCQESITVTQKAG